MLAIVEAYSAGLLKAKNWLPNITAGLIVGVVALPLAIAFAIASGVKPEQGLYTAIIASLCVSIFGGSRTQIAGPTGTLVVILANITAQYGVSGLQLATLMAGAILLLMGMIKLGNVIKFIPEPVMVGLTTGIGFIIFLSEWKDFFGLDIQSPLGAHSHQKLFALIKALPHLHLTTTLLASLSLLIVLLAPKFIKKVPSSLLALIIVTLASSRFQFQDVATLGSTFGALSSKLPTLHLPPITSTSLLALLGPAFTIALLGAIESLLAAQVADGLAGTRHNSNQELIGQGIANMVVPLLGGFAATGAIARTATNVRNGGNSPIAAIAHSCLLILVIVLLAPLVAYIPLCALAAILFVVAYKMSDIPYIIYLLKKSPWHDTAVLLVTFILTIVADLVIAVNVGVVLAMVLFVKHMYHSVSVELSSPVKEGDALLEGACVCSIKGPFFFGVAEKIGEALLAKKDFSNKVIFRLKEMPFMDMTGLKKLKEVLEYYHAQGVNIYICEANPIVSQKLKKAGLLEKVVGKCIFNSFNEASSHLVQG